MTKIRLTESEKKERQRKASAKYDKENTVGVHLKLNKGSDADIIEMLNESGNKQGLIKKLLRENKKKTK